MSLNKKSLRFFTYEPNLLKCRSDTIQSPIRLINEHEAMQSQGVIKLRSMNQYKRLKFIIFPDDNLKYIWDSIIAFSLLYTIIFTPYQIAFIDQDILALNVIDYIINVLFIIDIILNFFIAFENNEEVLIVSRKEIIRHYVTHSLLFDLISSFPYQLIIQNNSWGGVVRLSKIPRLYRMIKIIKLVRVLKVLKGLNQIVKCLECLSKISVGLERLIYLILFFFIICHLFACLIFFIGNFNSDNVNNWIYENGFQDMETEEKYLASVYWVITIFCTIGYGDITPKSLAERIAIMFIELTGVFFYSYTVATISSLMLEMQNHTSELKLHLSTLQIIAAKHSISERFHQKLRQALIYNSQKNHSSIKKVLSLLPKQISMELSIIVNQELIKTNKFFERKGLEFANEIIRLLKPLRVNSKEVIYKKGEFTEEIYLIQTGEVLLCDEEGDFEIVLDELHEGDYFGDFEVFLNDNHMFNARANQISELLTLAKEELFNSVLHGKNEVKYEMIVSANQRKKALLNKRNKEIQIFLQNPGGLHARCSIQNLNIYPVKKDYERLKNTLSPSTKALLDEEVSLTDLNRDLENISEELKEVVKYLSLSKR